MAGGDFSRPPPAGWGGGATAFGKMLKRPHFVTIGSGANRADGGVFGALSARFFVSMGWNFVSKGCFFVSKGWNFVSKGCFGAKMALKK